MASPQDFALYEILVNIWRFSERLFHSSVNNCHCAIHLLDCIIEAKTNWNDNFDDFSVVVDKIINHC